MIESQMCMGGLSAVQNSMIFCRELADRRVEKINTVLVSIN
ncbi:hypothetical protein SHDE107825_02305 [Shewanella denitrificans]